LIASLSLTPLLEEETCCSLIDVDNLDADANIVHSCHRSYHHQKYFHTRI
jgi:hypothetical protein